MMKEMNAAAIVAPMIPPASAPSETGELELPLVSLGLLEEISEGSTDAEVCVVVERVLLVDAVLDTVVVAVVEESAAMVIAVVLLLTVVEGPFGTGIVDAVVVDAVVLLLTIVERTSGEVVVDVVFETVLAETLLPDGEPPDCGPEAAVVAFVGHTLVPWDDVQSDLAVIVWTAVSVCESFKGVNFSPGDAA